MNAPRWHAIGTVDGEVAARFTAAGWQRTAEQGLGVVWCGDDWTGGIARLEELGEGASTTILMGELPPTGMGSRIRKRGGLAWASHPMPDWMLVALADTIRRSESHPPMTPVRRLVGYDAATDLTLDLFLEKLVESTGALGAHAGVWERQASQRVFRAITRDPPPLPPGLLESTLPLDAPVVIPNADEARICGPVLGTNAALSAVLSRQDPGRTDRILVLTWPKPFVPTAAEVQLVQLLVALARSTVRRIAERARLIDAHNRHVDALADMVPPRPGSSTPPLERFVTAVLQTHAPDPRIRAIHVRLSAHSRDEPRWVTWWRRDSRPSGSPTVRRSANPPSDVPDLDTLPMGPVLLPDGRWATVSTAGDDVHGSVVAITDNERAAIGIQLGLRDLARDLGLGAVLERWSADTTALMSLSRDQTHTLDPGLALSSMLDRVRQRMNADGVRLHVVRRAGLGHDLRTVAARPAEASIPEPEAALRSVLGEDRATIVQGPVSQHLLVPLHALGATAAIIEVWRESNHAFDDKLDSDALGRFAPHVAAAARRILHDDMLSSRVERMSALMQSINPDLPLHEAARLSVSHVGELVGAAAAVLLRRAPGQPRTIYVEAAWCIDADLTLTVQAATSAAVLALTPDELPDDTSWADEVADAMTPELVAWGLDTTYRPRLTISAPTPLVQPTSAILLMDAVPSDHLPHPFAPDIQDIAAAEFVHYTTALLEAATRNCARVCADRLATTLVHPDAISQEAAASLRHVTGADAVVVALGDRAHMRVRTVMPERPSLLGRVLGNSKEPDEGLLSDLATAYGWSSVRSSAHAFIDDRGRRLGVILLLSGPDGPTIGWHRRQVLRAVAQRTALEIDNAQRRAMLVDLNTLAGQLAGLVGERLSQRLMETLEPWVHRYIRADASIAVVARVNKEQPLIVTGSSTFSNEDLRELHLTSSRWGLADHVWTKDSDIDLIDAPQKFGLAVPVQLPENDKLSGHLFLFTGSPITESHLDIAREAAREISVVLDGERVRHGLMAQTGLFRHALLSPVQGLTDAAAFLADLALQPDASPELVNEQRQRIVRESDTIRRWKLIQKLYGGGILGNEITLHKRRQDLRPIVERCTERYRNRVAERNVDLRYDFDTRGRTLVDIDDTAMDLILSNLVENATKYAFRNRYICVGLYEDKAHFYLWVEDIGHATPEEIDIYATGARLDWEDATRVIHGEGMGLAIARSLVRAHGGDITHTCRAQTQVNAGPPDGREDTRPYKVRFTVSLPKATR